MYVDDIVGIFFVGDLDTDPDAPSALIRSGSESQRSILKALHDFAMTDVTARLNLKQAQRLASWGIRYGKICRVLRPFCSYLVDRLVERDHRVVQCLL